MKEISPKARGNLATETKEDSVTPLVLYVEDNADNRETAEVNLGKKYRMLFASNDREACKIFKEKGKELAIILMDIELKDSELNGIELTKLVRGVSKLTKLPAYARGVPVLKSPIIFLTAYGNTFEKTQVMLAGGTDLLEKPIDFVSLKLAMTKYYLSQQKGDD